MDIFQSPGLACFGSGNVYMGQSIVRLGKHGQAEGSFWFPAKSDDGGTDVGYLLTMIGDFIGVWPPSDTGATIMTLRTWELTAGNESAAVRDMSCLGEGIFLTDDMNPENDVVTIVVTLL